MTTTNGTDSGLIDVATGQHIFLFNNGSGVVGKAGTDATTANAGSTVSFNVTVDASGNVTLDQVRALQHSPDTGPNQPISILNDGAIQLVATITDKDGDTASAAVGIAANLTFLDDAGTLGAFSGPITVVNAQNATGHGTFVYNTGADGHGSFAITGAPLTGVTYVTTQNANGALLTATSDPDGPGGNPPITVFTLQVNTTGTYDFTLVTPEASTTTSVSLLGLTAGGPTPFVQTPDGLVEFSGSGSGINSSTQGFGIANQFVANGESFTIEFHAVGTAGDQASNVDPRYVTSATLNNNNINGSLTVTVIFHNDALGTMETQVINVTGTSTLLDPTTLSTFNWVEVIGTGGSGQGVRFSSLDYTTTVLPQGFTLNFAVTATDKDGDTTASQPITIDVSAHAPIVLDLNGDGVHFLDHTAGVVYDYNGTGIAHPTAWAAPGDGILVRDANHNGLVDNATEFVFGHDGMTDLEALHAQYGAQLDASDADFTMFAVWNDANSNGVVDPGELKSLAEAGIVSINLVSDGHSYITANGEVSVAGATTFTRADGSTGTAADAAFASSRTTADVARVAANSNSVVLAAAVAAAGLSASASSPAAASLGDTVRASHVTNAVVAVEAVSIANLHQSTDTAVPALMSEVREAFATPHFIASSPFATDMGSASIGDMVSGHGAMIAPSALLSGSELPVGQMALPMLASNIAMPSASALMAMAGVGNAQATVSVERIVAEALHGGGHAPDINALLNALPAQANGGNSGMEIAASLGNPSVPSWDTGHGAGFTFASSNVITTEALVLHHDAIQPIANG